MSIIINKSYLKLILASSLVVCSTVSAQIQFEESTDIAGPFGAGESWGSAWGDFNSDGYPDLIFGAHRGLSSYYQNNGDGSFTNRTADVDASYIWRDNPDDDTHGYTWADFDNDGDDDLFGAVSGQIDAQLLLNENDAFSLVSRERNLFDDYRGRMGIWFDYTNDGLLDISIPTNGFYLYRQNASNPGSFVRDNSSSLNCSNFHNYGLLIDANNDGHLDLICGREGAFPNKVYDVSGYPFVDITNSFPVVHNVNDAAIHDFNGDLLNDIAVTRGRMRPNKAVIVNDHRVEAWLDSGGNSTRGFKFKSAGSFSFDSAIHLVKSGSNIFLGAAGQHPPSKTFTVNPSNAIGLKASMGTKGLYIGYSPGTDEWTVIMQPGPDMRGYFMIDTAEVVSNLEMLSLGPGDHPFKPSIILNGATGFAVNNNAGFEEETCVSVASGDFDNDTDVDLYMVCRYGPENVANVLYENQGDATFVRIPDAGGAAGAIGKGLASGVGTGESVTVVDYDADGFLDLFVGNGLLMRPLTLGGKHQLFRNTGNDNNWVEIDLAGKGAGFSNRNGIGAKVYVTANNHTQLREQNGGYHRWSQNHQRIHFGLADADVLDITVEWPSGHVDVFEGLDSNRIYKLNEDGAVEILINNIPPEISVDDISVFESGIAELTVRLNRPYHSDVTVDFAATDLTAISTQDYMALSGSLVFTPNQTTQVVVVEILDDTDIEAQEDFSFTLSNASNASIIDGESVITIIDDDSPPEVAIDDVTVLAGDMAVFTVSLSHPFNLPVSVDYLTSDGSATNVQDYTGSSGTIYFSVGEISQQVTLQTIDDIELEPMEEFYVGLMNAFNSSISDDTGVATITSNGSPPCGRPTNIPQGEKVLAVYTLCNDPDIWYLEGIGDGSNQVITYEIELSSELEILAFDTVNFESSDSINLISPLQLNAEMNVIGTGYDMASITRTPGSKLCLAVNTPFDVNVIDYAGNPVTVFDGRYDVTNNSACGVPPFTISVQDVAILEGDIASVEISISEIQLGPVSVSYTTVDDSANEILDYVPTNGIATIAAGEISTLLLIDTLDDGYIEPDESFSVLLSNPGSGGLLSDDTGNILMQDSGGIPLPPTIEISDVVVTEGETATLNVSLTTTSTEEITVNYVLTADTATAVSDFTEDSGALVFSPGTISQSIDISTVDDTEVESLETLTVDFSSPVNAFMIDTVAAITLMDNDMPPCGRPTIDASTQQVLAVYSLCSDADVWYFELTGGGGSAAIAYDIDLDSDAPIIGLATDNFESNDLLTTINTMQVHTFMQVIKSGYDRAIVMRSPSAQLCMQINSPISANVINFAGTALPVVDGKVDVTENGACEIPPPIISFSDVSIVEGEDAIITVMLSSSYPTAVSVDYETVSGAASEGLDYVPVVGSLVFPAGTTSLPLSVTTMQDSDEEIDETFTVLFGNPVDAVLATTESIVTIEDNDGPPDITISGISVLEGATALVDVRLSHEYTQAVSVDYSSNDGTALDGFDYSSVAGTLLFAANEFVQQISIPTIDDSETETAEEFTITLTAPTNANIQTGSAVVTIDDNDMPPMPCGEPVFNPATERRLAVYTECGDPTTWYFKASAGGGSAAVKHQLVITSDNGTFDSIDTFSFESSDSIAMTSTQQVDTTMKMLGSGIDVAIVKTTSGAGVCLQTLSPTNIPVIDSLGQTFTSVNGKIDVTASGACNIVLPPPNEPSCGKPTIPGNQNLIAVWQDCSGANAGLFHVLSKAGSGTATRVFDGAITTTTSFTNLSTVGYENGDIWSNSPDPANLHYLMKAINNGSDEGRFRLSVNGEGCMQAPDKIPGNTKILFGAGAIEKTPPFNVVTGDDC